MPLEAPVTSATRFSTMGRGTRPRFLPLAGAVQKVQEPERNGTRVDRAAIIEAIERNEREFWLAYGRAEGGEARDGPEISSYLTGIREELFNGVVRLVASPDRVEAAIDAAIEPFRARRIPFEWTVAPGSSPGDLEARLRARGFRHYFDLTGMAVRLADLRETRALPPGLSIVPAEGTDALAAFFSILVGPFDLDPSCAAPAVRLESSLLEKDARLRRRYLGILDGRPVATSMLSLAGGAAGIYGVATAPEVRGRGIGAAMTLAPLLEARDLGYDLGVLQGSPMGGPVYRGLGFREYFREPLYTWRDPAARA